MKENKEFEVYYCCDILQDNIKLCSEVHYTAS